MQPTLEEEIMFRNPFDECLERVIEKVIEIVTDK